MSNPWDVRPARHIGDDTPEAIFLQVGAALTAWEVLESHMAELFDKLVAKRPSNRAAFAAFIFVRAASARTELLEAAAERALAADDPDKPFIQGVIAAFGKAGARRNEIAHGRVYDMGDRGFILGPNNVMPHKWTDDGAAKYQYCAEDIAHYAEVFGDIRAQCVCAISWVDHKPIIKRARSRMAERGKRT